MSSDTLGPLTWRPARRLLSVSGYGASVALILGLNLLFNVVDLVTSYVGLGRGLNEVNSLALGIAEASRLPIFGSLIILKLLFVSGAVATAIVAVRSRDPGTKRLLLRVIAISTLSFLVISLNNLFWILHVLA